MVSKIELNMGNVKLFLLQAFPGKNATKEMTFLSSAL